MKILHYILGLPPVRSGGLVKYALDIVKSQIENGHEVELLIPGKMQWNQQEVCKIKRGMFQSIPCYRIENALPVSGGVGIAEIERLYQYGDEKVYKSFLLERKPDVLHVHSFMGLHLACLKAAEQLGIPIIYTTHDYYGLCPKASLLKQGRICNEKSWDTCSNCLEKKASLKKLSIKQSEGFRLLEANKFYQWIKSSPMLLSLKQKGIALLKKEKIAEQTNESDKKIVFDKEIEKYTMLRNYYLKMFSCVTAFHFNSAQTRDVFEAYLGKLNGQVITISNRSIKDCRTVKTHHETIKIGFVGHGAETKGFHILRSALDELYKDGVDNFECHIYFKPKEKNLPYMKLHRPYEESQVAEVYGNMDVLVVPSICKETFCMAALEALSYGVPVILSKYVGAKDYLLEQPGMGIVVNPEKEELKGVIKDLCQNPVRLLNMNKKIGEWKHSFSYEEHVQEIVKLYQEELT